MRGFPKWFNTRQDVYNALELFPEETKEWVRIQHEGRFIWENTEALSLKEGVEDDGVTPLVELVEGGVEDETHRVVRGGEGEYWQQELVENSRAVLYRLGLDNDEIADLLE